MKISANSTHRANLAAKSLAGAVGGIVGSLLMNKFQASLSKLDQPLERSQPEPPKGDDATVKTAQKISDAVGGHRLTPAEKKWAGPLVHYSFGALVGALYGGLSDKVPLLSASCGALYGAAIWLGAVEIAVPAAGLAPQTSRLGPHLKALASHLVYGISLELSRRAVLKALPN
jgi:putative membrane protein